MAPVALVRPIKETVQERAAERVCFPFAAIVGQEEMKQALAGQRRRCHGRRRDGVRRPGHRQIDGGAGAGGSAAADAAVAGCRYNCDPAQHAALCPECRGSGRRASCGVLRVPIPVVDLPLGATEDRVVGALDLERALTRGEKAFEPGCWHARIGVSSTSMKSICWKTIWSICCWTWRRLARTSSSGRA